MIKKLFALFCAIIFCIGLAGCGEGVENTPDVAPSITPAPTVTPLAENTKMPVETQKPPLDKEGVVSLGRETFNRFFAPHFSRYDFISGGMLDMAGLMEKQAMYADMSFAVGASLNVAAKEAYNAIQRRFDVDEELCLNIKNPLDWRLVAALCAVCKDPEGMIVSNTAFEITVDENDRVGIYAALPDFDKMFESVENGERFRALLLFSYLNTAYDDFGEIRDNDGAYELSDEYIATILDPLPRRNIKDGWYGDRSHATRRHTGTDIRASEGTDIPSCTAGTVLRIGYDDISGNFVAIVDESGFIYFYCHMVELTTFLFEGQSVEQGELIGHVGDTGNSDAPHLHLAIIAPEKCYINPYPVLHRVRYGR